MTTVTAISPPLNVRAEIPASTHKALRIKQSKEEIKTGVRPQMTEIVAQVLNEWAEQQGE